MSSSTLSGRQVADAGLDGWAYLLGTLRTRIRTPDFATGLALLAAVGEAAAMADHHPDVDLRFGHVDVAVTSHDAGGVTDRDVRLARRVTELAQQAGLVPECASVSRLELGLDTPAYDAVQPFWAAVLGAVAGPDDVRAPYGDVPTVWFQPSGAQEPRQRWHPDVWVDPAQVQPRIEAATAAGGLVVSDREAPSFWVLADPEGNRVCLCTWQDRDAP